MVFTGVVRDAATGEPLPRFHVAAYIDGQAPGREFASAEGTFEILGLEPGPIEVTVSAEGYADYVVAERDYSRGEYDFDVALVARRSLVLSVVDAHGVPHGRGKVQAFDYAGNELAMGNQSLSSSQADILDGKAILHGLPAAIVTLRVDVDGFPQDFEVDLSQSVEGAMQLVVTPVERAPFAALVVVLDAATSEAEFTDRRGTREEIGLALRTMLLDGTIAWPETTVEITLLDPNGEERGRSTIAPLADGMFQVDTRYREGSTGHGQAGPQPMPGFDVKMPTGPLTVRVHAAGYQDFERLVQHEAAGPDAMPHFLILRRD